MRVLAMDDSRLIHQILLLLLKPVGVQLDLANSAPAALAHIQAAQQQNTPYDCFLLDLNCPGFEADPDHKRYGGYQLVSLLRQDKRRQTLLPLIAQTPPRYTSPPILVFTSETDPDLIHRVEGEGDRRLGATHVLQKSEYLNVNSQSLLAAMLKRLVSSGSPIPTTV